MPTNLLVVCVAINAVLGQLFLKRTLATLGGRTVLTHFPKFIAAAATSPWMYATIVVQGLGFYLWMLLVSREKLGVAVASVGAAFYILLPLSAWAIYGESLTSLQWLGLILITIGVACVSLNAS
jgi:drug/metabolite transporter (DMT)-like permease